MTAQGFFTNINTSRRLARRELQCKVCLLTNGRQAIYFVATPFIDHRTTQRVFNTLFFDVYVSMLEFLAKKLPEEIGTNRHARGEEGRGGLNRFNFLPPCY